MRALDLPQATGTAVRVRIEGREHEATAGDGSFAVRPGQMALALGSSGWTVPGGKEVRWLEVFLRGGNAWAAFGQPSIGSQVEVAP